VLAKHKKKGSHRLKIDSIPLFGIFHWTFDIHHNRIQKKIRKEIPNAGTLQPDPKAIDFALWSAKKDEGKAHVRHTQQETPLESGTVPPLCSGTKSAISHCRIGRGGKARKVD
jgi:hypothetical protein